MDLTDKQWSVVSSIMPELLKRRDGRGRPWRCSRAVLDGILWILRTGAPWYNLVADRSGLTVVVHLQSASSHEVVLDWFPNGF